MNTGIRFCVAAGVLLAGVSRLAAVDARQEIRLPDIPGYVTLKCDFHMHSVFSDGQVWPTWRVDEAWRDGLDAIALTDHVEYQPKKDDVPTNPNRPADLAAGLARERNVIVIRGAEITKEVPPGHFNALFLKDITSLATNDLTAQLEAARAQDAFVFWNHPGWRVKPGVPVILPVHEELCAKGLIQGVEIFNGSEAYTNGWPWGLEHKLTLMADSDTHVPLDPPQPRHEGHRTMTLVFAKERTAEGIREALKAGRTAVWAGGVVAGAREVLEPLFAGCVIVRPPHHRAKAAVWLEIRNDSDLAFTLTRTAGPGPEKLTLAAGKTAMVKVAVNAESLMATLDYTVDNLLTAPGAALPVKWTVKAVKP